MKENKLDFFLKVLYLVIFSVVLSLFIFCQDTKFIQSEKELKIEFGAQVEKVPKRTIIDKKENLDEKIIHPNELVMVIPSQKQLDSLQATMDEDEYMTFVDESNYYVDQAKEYCEHIHSLVVEVESGTKLICISEKGEKLPFSTKGLIWDMIVFNGITKPEQIDITSPQEEIIRVYNKAKLK
ncbi:MAG: hypothetical protein ACOVMH_05325 [Flavobacterium sp.]